MQQRHREVNEKLLNEFSSHVKVAGEEWIPDPSVYQEAGVRLFPFTTVINKANVDDWMGSHRGDGHAPHMPGIYSQILSTTKAHLK